MRLNTNKGIIIFGNIDALYNTNLETFIDYTLPQCLVSLEDAMLGKNRKELLNTLIKIKGGSE